MRAPEETIRAIQRNYLAMISSVLSSEERRELVSIPPHRAVTEAHQRFNAGGLRIPTRNGYVTPFEYRFDQLLEGISKFWEQNARDLLQALRDSEGYRVEISTSNIRGSIDGYIRRLGIYFETMILEDPLHYPRERLSVALGREPNGMLKDIKLNLFHDLLILLRLSHLTDADTGRPLVIFAADVVDQPIGTPELVSSYLAKHVSTETQQISASEIGHILRSKNAQAAAALPNQAGLRSLLATMAEEASASERIAAILPQGGVVGLTNSAEFFKNADSFQALASLHWFYYTKLNAFLRNTTNAFAYRADPVIPIDRFETYVWLEKENGRQLLEASLQRSYPHQVAAHALASKEMEFLEAVSMEDLKRLRESGVFDDLRREIYTIRMRFGESTEGDFSQAADGFRDDLFRLFDEFTNERGKLTKKNRNRVRLTTGGFAGSLTLGIASIAFSATPLVGLLAGAVSLGIGINALDVWKAIKEREVGLRKLTGSNVGILAGYYQKHRGTIRRG
jgi:hypothetical protein